MRLNFVICEHLLGKLNMHAYKICVPFTQTDDAWRASLLYKYINSEVQIFFYFYAELSFIQIVYTSWRIPSDIHPLLTSVSP